MKKCLPLLNKPMKLILYLILHKWSLEEYLVRPHWCTCLTAIQPMYLSGLNGLLWINTNSSFVRKVSPKNSNLKPISVTMLKKYLFKVGEAVEKKITVKVTTTPLFALLFDSWTEYSTHFVGLFIVYPGKEPSDDPGLHLLAFAPLLDQTNFAVVNHANFINASLEWNSLSLSHMFCLIGDNCQTNRATVGILGVPLLGCLSHCCNLAVEAYLQKFLSSKLELVSKLMFKLATLKQSGKLHLMASLHPVNQNLTH